MHHATASSQAHVDYTRRIGARPALTLTSVAWDPKDVTSDTVRDLSSVVGELAALKGDATHWLTDSEYAALRIRLEGAHAAAEAAYVDAKRRRNTKQFVIFGVQPCFDTSDITLRSVRCPLYL
jgi:hypothetical protein